MHSFVTDEWSDIYPDMEAPAVRTRGHGGADYFLVDSFVKAVARLEYLIDILYIQRDYNVHFVHCVQNL